jgi:hypothetical protein
MKYIFFILFTAFLLPAYAQQRIIDVRNNGLLLVGFNQKVGSKPLSADKYAGVAEGSAYFDTAWMSGSVLTSEGLEYQNLLLRLDLVANVVEYKNDKGEEFIATAPVNRVTLTDSVTNRSWYFVHSSAVKANTPVANGWYQVLADGKAVLFKYVSRTINESRQYNSATVEQRIVTPNQYYLLHNSGFSRVKKLKDLTEHLGDKKAALAAFIDSQNLSGKTEFDYSAIVSHYNGIREK